MRRTKTEKVRDRLEDADGGWVCIRTLWHPQVGGNRAGARVHELREAGVVVERRSCECHQCRYHRENAKRRNEPAVYVSAYRIPAEVSA